jgi:hypothetical protein
MLAGPELSEPIRSYDDLHRALRARANELNFSRAELDRLAGVTSGYASKLLAPRPLKRMSPYTFTLMVGALGIRLRVEEDPEALERISRFAQKREVQVPMRARAGLRQAFLLAAVEEVGFSRRRHACISAIKTTPAADCARGRDHSLERREGRDGRAPRQAERPAG